LGEEGGLSCASNQMRTNLRNMVGGGNPDKIEEKNKNYILFLSDFEVAHLQRSFLGRVVGKPSSRQQDESQVRGSLNK